MLIVHVWHGPITVSGSMNAYLWRIQWVLRWIENTLVDTNGDAQMAAFGVESYYSIEIQTP